MTMIARSDTKKNGIARRAGVWLGSGALITALAAAATPAALAQQSGDSGIAAESASGKLPDEPTLRHVPQSVVPIFSRAADLLRIAERRQRTAPEDARPSFRLAAQYFRRFLAAGGYSPNVASTDGASIAGSGITPGQAAVDVHTIRSAAAALSTQAAILERAANLYDRATQNFIAGQMRVDAFVQARQSSPSSRTAALNRAARANAAAQLSSSDMTLASSSSQRPVTRGRAVTVVIHGSHQDQVTARQQGMKSLQDLYASESAAAAAQAAQAAADDTANQQAYLNQGWNSQSQYASGPVTPLTPYGGYLIPPVASALPSYNISPINAATPYGGIILGGGTVLAPNPLVPTVISPQPITIGGGGAFPFLPAYNFGFGY